VSIFAGREAYAHSSSELDGAQDALTKMQRAYKRGTGCHLTADQIRSLSLTSIGELWDDQDPRKSKGQP
jgi:hypothetical protein